MSSKIKCYMWLKSKLRIMLFFIHLPNININCYKKFTNYYIIDLLIVIDAKSISILIIYNRNHNIYFLLYIIFILLKIIIQKIKLIYKTRAINTGFSIRFFFFIKPNNTIFYFF